MVLRKSVETIDSVHRIEAEISYDGDLVVPAIMTGHTLHFTLPGVMGDMEFLVFGALTVDEPIAHGGSGRCTFQIVATDRERPHLVRGTKFALQTTREPIATGMIISAFQQRPPVEATT